MGPLKQKVEDYLPDKQVVRILLNAWNWIKTNNLNIYPRKRVIYEIS